MKLTSNVVVVFGNPDNGGLIGEGEVPPVNKEATIAPPLNSKNFLINNRNGIITPDYAIYIPSK